MARVLPPLLMFFAAHVVFVGGAIALAWLG